ncbi:MAG: aminoacyl-tRNA hydrolase [Chloroflexi bacterium]|nr:aminoacyl-tRNA hydrolase [Chloroflexota bacterium]
MRVIIGLGNPGRDYARNRHNVGFRCVNHLARKHGISLGQRNCQAQHGTGRIEGTEVVLAKPRTFMNLSGRSAGLLLRRFRAAPADLVVIHDDLDLALGRIRLYSNGGSGGHKGIESIVAALGSCDFLRVRVGIGRPRPETDAVDYVLGDFSPSELTVVEETVARVGEAVSCLLKEGLAAAMNRYNQSPGQG